MPFFRPLVPRQSPVLRNDVSLLHDSVAAVRLVMGPARLLPAGLNRLFNGIGEVTSIVEVSAVRVLTKVPPNVA